MTTLDEARRRTTDQILADAMTESGNHDAERAAETGKPLHFDPYADLDGHRAAASGAVRAEEALGQVGGGAGGKGASAAADAAIHAAFGAALRGGLGAAFQGLGSAALVHELFWNCIERSNREGDKQRNLGASDAGVVALANALPFDASFKSAVTNAHRGSSNAAVAMRSTLEKPEHASALAAMRLRSDKGLMDAAPLARDMAEDIAALAKQRSADLAHARELRASGRDREAEVCENAAARALDSIDFKQRAFVTQFPKAHEDAAYGLGVQCALFHALRAELGNERPDVLDGLVESARRDRAHLEPAAVQVRG